MARIPLLRETDPTASQDSQAFLAPGADMGTRPPQDCYTRNAVTMPCGWLSDCGGRVVVPDRPRQYVTTDADWA